MREIITYLGEKVDQEWIDLHYPRSDHDYIRAYIDELLKEAERRGDAAWEATMGEDA